MKDGFIVGVGGVLAGALTAAIISIGNFIGGSDEPSAPAAPNALACPAPFVEADLGSGSGHGILPDVDRPYLACVYEEHDYILTLYANGERSLARNAPPYEILTEPEAIDAVLQSLR